VVTDEDHRLAQAGLIAPQTSSLAVRTGVLIAPGATALVTGTSATGTMTVNVAAHHWVTTRGAADGVYIGALEAATTANIAAAPGANSRIDVVYVKQNDSGSTISPDGSTTFQVGVTTGTAGVSPTKPAIPVGAQEIATVTVAAGATSTNGAGVTISNTAPMTAARGARIHVRSQTERDALTAFAGLEVYRIDTGAVELRNAANSAWVKVYDPTAAAVQSVTMAGGWTVVTTVQCYKPTPNEVACIGRVTNTSSYNPTSAPAVVFTLPVGYRPSVARTGTVGLYAAAPPVLLAGIATNGQVSISHSGNVSIASGNSHYFDILRFFLD
jgi:hypothetical protein